MEQMKQEQFITRRIGGTTYKVRVAFSETAVETMEEKILRMIRNEGVTNVGTYDIMEAPQMSRQSDLNYREGNVGHQELAACSCSLSGHMIIWSRTDLQIVS